MASTSSIPACLTATAPVLGHPGLESDVTLSTEVLPGPPPLLSKRDLKKPVYSYVPSTDPGTSYCGSVHGTTSHPDPASDQASSGRGQRASARNHQSAAVAPSLPPPSTNPSTMNSSRPLESLVPAFGKSTSRTIILPPLQHPAPAPPGGRTRRRDKGKARETDRVKDEAVTIDSPSPVESLVYMTLLLCGIQSQLIIFFRTAPATKSASPVPSLSVRLYFVTAAPNPFIFCAWIPPWRKMRFLPTNGFVRAASSTRYDWRVPTTLTLTRLLVQHPPRKPPPSLMAPLLHHLETSPPQVFELPLDIREHFKDIGTSAKGTYVDTSDVKHYRPNKYGLVEPRDPHRLRDRDGSPILCFRSAQSGPAPDDVWKNMISCDYCDLHWHLDCLDPPRLTMPSASKKFMCPNHAEKVKPIKLRIPKLNAPPIDIKKAGLYNNGNIDIVQPIIPPSSETGALDDTVKYGRKFRVPEKVVLLDFWAKVSGPDRSTSPDEYSLFRPADYLSLNQTFQGEQ
ncbi:hypothetical protein DL96DRAFT_1598969 [Flagelloscypha sp. PMI_526]|nr:hypothetical protein DL96DRAFT_1598969 [Flagelloscypha sp. PMI_526]